MRHRGPVLVHFDNGVQQTPSQHRENSQHPQDCRLVAPNVKRHERLDGRLGRARNIVRQGRGGLDLQDRHNADGKAEESRHGHGRPEGGRNQLVVHVLHDGLSLEVGDEGYEEEACIDVVVEGETPVIVVDDRQYLLGEYRIERDEERGHDARARPQEGKVDFAVPPHEEPEDDHEEARDGPARGGYAEQRVREEDVEHDGERSGDVVERHLDPLEAEVVEGDHPHEDNRQGEDSPRDGHVVGGPRELSEEGRPGLAGGRRPVAPAPLGGRHGVVRLSSLSPLPALSRDPAD
mmetsp:Transcript_20422/g.59115  ORF Transcript_20422/g.59115 Transcript_20422/m.59115 type:complete len:292 (-) Transcript_20422:437-1312(-)